MKRYLCLLVILTTVFALNGCNASGRINSTSYDPKTGKNKQIQYSEYLEDVRVVGNGALKFHLVITLGSERLPKNYKIQNKWGRIDRSQGDIEEVYEIYITNLSSKKRDLQLQSINGMRLAPSSTSIKPKSYVKTNPLVRVSSVYKTETDYVIAYKYQGKAKKLKGSAKRLTVKGLQKYKQ